MMPPIEATARFRSRMSDGEMQQLWRDLLDAGCAVTCRQSSHEDDDWTIALHHPGWDAPLEPDAVPFYYYYRRDPDGTWRIRA